MFCSSYEVYSWIAGFKKDFYEKLRKVGWGLGADFVENFGIFCQEIHVLSCLWAWLKMSKIPNVSVLIWRHMNGYFYVEIFKAILYETRPEAKLRHFFFFLSAHRENESWREWRKRENSECPRTWESLGAGEVENRYARRRQANCWEASFYLPIIYT